MGPDEDKAVKLLNLVERETGLLGRISNLPEPHRSRMFKKLQSTLAKARNTGPDEERPSEAAAPPSPGLGPSERTAPL